MVSPFPAFWLHRSGKFENARPTGSATERQAAPESPVCLRGELAVNRLCGLAHPFPGAPESAADAVAIGSLFSRELQDSRRRKIHRRSAENAGIKLLIAAVRQREARSDSRFDIVGRSTSRGPCHSCSCRGLARLEHPMSVDRCRHRNGAVNRARGYGCDARREGSANRNTPLLHGPQQHSEGI